MSKKLIPGSVVLLALTLLAAPIRKMQAQAAAPPPSPSAVTGGDPQPTGEPDLAWLSVSWITVLSTVLAVGVS